MSQNDYLSPGILIIIFKENLNLFCAPLRSLPSNSAAKKKTWTLVKKNYQVTSKFDVSMSIYVGIYIIFDNDDVRCHAHDDDKNWGVKSCRWVLLR